MRALLALLLSVRAAAAAPAQAGSRSANEAHAAAIVGGRVYLARVDAGGASVALWRYAASGSRRGPPVLILSELGIDRRLAAPLAEGLQARGREAFILEWRNTGRSTRAARGAGGLEALFGGDAPAALEAALVAARADRVQLVGVGLGGAAAYLLAARDRRVSSVVALSVPAAYEVPNAALRKLLAAGRAVVGREGAPKRASLLSPWSALLPVLPGKGDLLRLLLAHGDGLSAQQLEQLRAGLGALAPELVQDVVHWMEQGDLALPPGPLAPAQRLSAALDELRAPVLCIAAPRDNLVHPEHALALRRHAAHAERDELVLSRIEGFPEDSGHLALAAPAARAELIPRIASWLAAHP